MGDTVAGESLVFELQEVQNFLRGIGEYRKANMIDFALGYVERDIALKTKIITHDSNRSPSMHILIDDDKIYDCTPPEIKMIQIWSEGYIATGESSVAVHHITIQASNLKEACIKYAEIDEQFATYFNKDQMTLWGCKLFDNEQDARKSFG